MIYSIYQDELAQGIVAYENDELDFAEVPGSDFERVKNDATLERGADQSDRSYTRFVICDCTNAPTRTQLPPSTFDVVDRKTLTTGPAWTVVPAPTLLPPDIPGYNHKATIGEDVDEAKDLLAEAGHADPGTIELSMVYISTATTSWTPNTFSRPGKKPGLDITLEPIEQNSYNDWRASREDITPTTFTLETGARTSMIRSTGTTRTSPTGATTTGITGTTLSSTRPLRRRDRNRRGERGKEYQDAGMILAAGADHSAMAPVVTTTW